MVASKSPSLTRGEGTEERYGRVEQPHLEEHSNCQYQYEYQKKLAEQEDGLLLVPQERFHNRAAYTEKCSL